MQPRSKYSSSVCGGTLMSNVKFAKHPTVQLSIASWKEMFGSLLATSSASLMSSPGKGTSGMSQTQENVLSPGLGSLHGPGPAASPATQSVLPVESTRPGMLLQVVPRSPQMSSQLFPPPPLTLKMHWFGPGNEKLAAMGVSGPQN